VSEYLVTVLRAEIDRLHEQIETVYREGRAAARTAVLEEREACAKIAETGGKGYRMQHDGAPAAIAAAIRGKTEERTHD